MPAFVEVLVLLAATALTIRAVRHIGRPAARLPVPYLPRAGHAATPNFGVVQSDPV